MTRTLRAGLFALGLLLLAHGTSAAARISVTMYDYDATHGGNPDLYSAAPGGGGAFWAFIAYGGSYLFDGLQSAAMNGGASGGNPDPVSDASRWLCLMVSTGLYSTSTYSSAFDFNASRAPHGPRRRSRPHSAAGPASA